MKSLLLLLLLCSGAFAQSSTSSYDKAKVSEIYLEMAQGAIGYNEPTGRTFMVTFRRDGTASYVGVANVGLIGTFEGRISAEAFDNLAALLVAKKYYDISDELPARMRDTEPNAVHVTGYESPVVITGVMYDGKPKFIKRSTIVPNDRKNTIPKEIFAIEDAITEAAKKIRWHKAANP